MTIATKRMIEDEEWWTIEEGEEGRWITIWMQKKWREEEEDCKKWQDMVEDRTDKWDMHDEVAHTVHLLNVLPKKNLHPKKQKRRKKKKMTEKIVPKQVHRKVKVHLKVPHQLKERKKENEGHFLRLHLLLPKNYVNNLQSLQIHRKLKL